MKLEHLEVSQKRLSEFCRRHRIRTTRDRFSEIPWLQITGMRNRLIRGYDQVDLQVLWDTITDDLPRLIKDLEKALKKL